MDLDSEMVILNTRTGIYYGLEDVGTIIWGLMQKPITIDEIYRIVIDEYEVDPERCKHDILSFFEELSSEGLMEAQYKKHS